MDSLETVTLDWAIAQALEKNPQIKASQQRWKAAQQREPQVSSLDYPNLSYTRWLSTPETRVGPQLNVFTLSQRLPFFGKLVLKGNMAGEDAVGAEEQYQATRRDVAYKIKLVYYDLYWIDHSIEILNRYQELLEAFWRVAESKYRTGTGIQANVLKAELEIASIEDRRLSFEKMRDGAAARLNALLNRNTHKPVGPITEMDTTFIRIYEQKLIQKAITHRQELRSAEAVIRKSGYALSLAKRNYWPDFHVMANYISIPAGRTAAVDNGKDAFSVQLGLSLPLWFGKLDAAVQEAKASKLANLEIYENLENEVRAEIADLSARIRTSQRTISLYTEQLLPSAERTLESALASYQTGSLDFLSLLDSERMLLNFRLAYVKELASYWQQVAALERTVGGTLP
ncbi:MAG: TolC family protein [Bacteroidota bacterium]